MVNTGKPSFGCHACRKRRIKCDEAKPGCRRCFKSRRECPGYRDESDLIFHGKPFGSHTAFRIPSFLAPSNSSPPSTPSSSESSDFIKSELGRNVQITQLSSPFSEAAEQWASIDEDSSFEKLFITPSLRYDFEDQSVCLLFQNLVEDARTQYCNSNYELLPTMVAESGSGSSLRKAVRAVASLNLANRLGYPVLELQAKREYGEALVATNAALRDPELCLSDETLISIWAFGLFETLLKFSPQSFNHRHYRPAYSEWKTHVDGTMTLMKMRGLAQFSTPRGRQAFRITYTAVQRMVLMYGQEEPEELAKLEDYIYNTFRGKDTPMEKVTMYIRQVSRLRWNMRYRISETAEMSDITKLLQQAKLFDKDMVGWNDERSWDRVEISNRVASPASIEAILSRTDDNLEKMAIYAYPSFWVYIHYMKYYTAYIILQETVIRLMRRLLITHMNATDLELQITGHQCLIQYTADEIIGSVAYAFGDYNQYGLPRARLSGDCDVISTLQAIWPLNILQHSADTTPGQREVAKFALERIAQEFRRRQS